jgi:hypothetical protein
MVVMEVMVVMEEHLVRVNQVELLLLRVLVVQVEQERLHMVVGS